MAHHHIIKLFVKRFYIPAEQVVQDTEHHLKSFL